MRRVCNHNRSTKSVFGINKIVTQCVLCHAIKAMEELEAKIIVFTKVLLFISNENLTFHSFFPRIPFYLLSEFQYYFKAFSIHMDVEVVAFQYV